MTRALPVEVDEIDGTSIARLQELLEPAETLGVGWRGVCDAW